VKTLEKEHTTLEPLRAGHASAMFEGDERHQRGLPNRRLYEFIAEEPPESVSTLTKRYARLEVRRPPVGHEIWLNWVLLTKPTLRPCGYVQATLRGTRASIAYVLFEDAWGRGLASEAVDVMIEHLRDAYSVLTVLDTVLNQPWNGVKLPVPRAPAGGSTKASHGELANHYAPLTPFSCRLLAARSSERRYAAPTRPVTKREGRSFASLSPTRLDIPGTCR
jgi:hypothetical protein